MYLCIYVFSHLVRKALLNVIAQYLSIYLSMCLCIYVFTHFVRKVYLNVIAQYLSIYLFSYMFTSIGGG